MNAGMVVKTFMFLHPTLILALATRQALFTPPKSTAKLQVTTAGFSSSVTTSAIIKSQNLPRLTLTNLAHSREAQSKISKDGK